MGRLCVESPILPQPIKREGKSKGTFVFPSSLQLLGAHFPFWETSALACSLLCFACFFALMRVLVRVIRGLASKVGRQWCVLEQECAQVRVHVCHLSQFTRLVFSLFLTHTFSPCLQPCVDQKWSVQALVKPPATAASKASAIDDELLDRLGKQACIPLDNVDREQLKRDLTRTVAFIEQIQAVDTTGVEPLVSLSEFRCVESSCFLPRNAVCFLNVNLPFPPSITKKAKQ